MKQNFQRQSVFCKVLYISTHSHTHVYVCAVILILCLPLGIFPESLRSLKSARIIVKLWSGRTGEPLWLPFSVWRQMHWLLNEFIYCHLFRVLGVLSIANVVRTHSRNAVCLKNSFQWSANKHKLRTLQPCFIHFTKHWQQHPIFTELQNFIEQIKFYFLCLDSVNVCWVLTKCYALS